MNYREKPILIGTIKGAGDKGGATFGTTCLNGELFALCYYSEVIKVYDVNAPYQLKREWKIPGLQCPGDIKTWTEKDALFVIDWTEIGKRKEMHIVDRDGISISTFTMEDDFGRLFITKETTIVEPFHDQNALVEFTAEGKETDKIPIPPETGIKGLQHAIKLNDDQFVLSHGDPPDKLHRVCLVDGKGNLQKSFGGEKGSDVDQLDVPVYLAVDRNGSVLVLDKFNGRVRLLNSDLEFQKDLVTREDGLRFPVKMELDEDKGLLYLADNDRISGKMKDGQVLIYNIKV